MNNLDKIVITNTIKNVVGYISPLTGQGKFYLIDKKSKVAASKQLD